mgnify:CR=1 FL=1
MNYHSRYSIFLMYANDVLRKLLGSPATDIVDDKIVSFGPSLALQLLANCLQIRPNNINVTIRPCLHHLGQDHGLTLVVMSTSAGNKQDFQGLTFINLLSTGTHNLQTKHQRH